MTDINSMIIYGGAGVGKTFVTAQVMPDALWLVTRKSNLGGYNTWVRQNPKEAAARNLKLIEKAVVPIPRMVADADGNMLRADVREIIRGMVQEYVKKAMAGDTKVRGIVFDELSIIAKWVFDAIKEEERNGFEVINQIKEWVAELCEISAVTELPMAFLCHAKDPAFHDKGPKEGSLKYKGGPAMPVGTMIAEVCALPDAVLHMDVESGGLKGSRRVIRTEAHPHWERKCRVWGTPPVMEPDLRPLLAQAGWNFPGYTAELPQAAAK